MTEVSDNIWGDSENEGDEYDILAEFTRAADKKKLRKPKSNASNAKKLKKKDDDEDKDDKKSTSKRTGSSAKSTKVATLT